MLFHRSSDRRPTRRNQVRGEDGAVLIAIGGLPGVGKTTVARALAGRLRGANVRIDALEAGLVTAGLVGNGADVGAAGYTLALAVADSCLAVGTDVVVDAVFPVAASRERWTALAERHSTPAHWVRLVCGDPVEHRRRVESGSPIYRARSSPTGPW